MQRFNKKNIHFYSELPHFISRIRILSCFFLIAWPVSEYIFTEVYTFYPSNWYFVLSFSASVVVYLVLIRLHKLNKGQIAYWISISAAIATIFLIYRAVITDFTTLILAQIGAAIIFLTFLFDRKRFVAIFILPVLIAYLISLNYIVWSNENHLVYCILLLLLVFFFIMAYYFKLFRLQLLRFSEKVISGFDQYIMVTNEKGDLVFLNDYAAKQFDFDLKRMSLKNWWEFRGYSADEMEAMKSQIKLAISKNERIKTYEQEVELPSGKKVTIEWNDQIIGGRFYFGIGTDISEQKESQREANKLSKVTQALNAGIVLSDENGKVTWCNSSVEEIFGYEEHELLGKRPSEIFKVPKFFKAKYQQILLQGIKEGQPVEIAHYDKAGKLIWILLNVSKLSDNGGETIEVITDITDQKNKEFEFKQISLIATRTQTPVLICDTEHVINWGNDAIIQEFQLELSEIIGNDFFDQYTNPQLDIDQIDQLKKSVTNFTSTQVEIRLKNNGRNIWYKLFVDPVVDDSNNISQFMIIMQNIQQFKDAQLLIEQKNKDMVDSISYAKRIQSSIMPNHQSIRSFMPPYFFYFKPKDIVSGDFYFVKRHNKLTFIAVADCTGHGVPGAMISSIGSAALNNAIFDQGLTKPAEILEHTDKYLKNALSANNTEMTDGMDLGLLVMDEENGKFLFAGARRPLILVDRNTNESELIKATKRSIGEFHEDTELEPFAVHEFNLNSTKNIYLFTDGIPDQFGGDKHKKIGLKRIMLFIEKINSLTIDERKHKLEQEMNNWMEAGQAEQTDDMLFFCMDLEPKE